MYVAKDIDGNHQFDSINLNNLPARGEITQNLFGLSKTYDQVVWENGSFTKSFGLKFKEAYFRITTKIPRSKRFILILSSMRSGSTLLKALLANHPDFSHLPETNFQQNAPLVGQWRYSMGTLAKTHNIVLKLPCSFRECLTYPVLPSLPGIKKIIIYRSPIQTLQSIQRMNSTKKQYLDLSILDLLNYWCVVYERIMDSAGLSRDTLYVNYETLTNSPRETTRNLFKWLGIDSLGFDSYNRPGNFEWQWNLDDGGPVIKTLRVQPPRIDDQELDFFRSLMDIPRVRAVYEDLQQFENRTYGRLR